MAFWLVFRNSKILRLGLFLIAFFSLYYIGLYRTSGPVRKSGEFSKSGLSRNRTFSFPDAGL
jgi:hypothetical protein